MAQEQFDDNLLQTDLRGKAAEPGLILVGRDTHHELLAEVFCQLLLEAERRLVVNIVTIPEHAQSRAEVILRKSLHPNQQTATLSWSSCPAVNPLVERFPTAKVKVAHAKICPLRQGKCFPQRR